MVEQENVAVNQEAAEQVEEVYEEVEQHFSNIDDLVNFGINAQDIKKLKEGGFHSIEGLGMFTKKELCACKGISENKVDKILEAVNKNSSLLFQTGNSFMKRRGNVIKITTGSEVFDELLGGGIETMSITEAFGEFRSGKTQLALTLAVTAQLPTSMKGGNGRVIFIDTEGTFRPERIIPIAERYGMDPSQALENILVARVYTHEAQIDLVKHAAARMAEERFVLLIVDSSTALFRVDFTGRGELSERQQKMGRFLSRLMKLSEEFNCACFITNQVMSNPDGSMFMADPRKPIGGNIMAHASTTRLYLKKGRGETRICKVGE